MGSLYEAFSAAVPTTTASMAKVALGTAAMKTLIQVATPAGGTMRIVEWGIATDTPASASVVAAELADTNYAATGGTSFTPVGYNADGNSVASVCTGGTSATCFAPSAEGTYAGTTRPFEETAFAPPYEHIRQFPLGREPYVGPSRFLKVRASASVACSAVAWVVWEE